jgi:tryptophanyl-tRNA synthetase
MHRSTSGKVINETILGLYKSEDERTADIMLANASTSFRFVPVGSDQLRFVETSGQEREVLKEQQVEAVARLTIDLAMK